MKTISIVTPCYNEEQNVEEVYERVRQAMAQAGPYRYEHIFIDNHSTDGTLAKLKELAARDHNVKVIANARNFGHVRSPAHAVFQAHGDAIIGLAGDLQEPPEIIPQFIAAWEKGYSMVLGIKTSSQENRLMFWIRSRYYRLLNRLSSIHTFEGFTGFGLFDRRVIDIAKSFDDPYPFFRGMFAEIGLPHTEVPYYQPRRKRGITTHNFYTLYDMAMLGITSFSKVPLRLVTFGGFAGAALCFLAGLFYLIYKLVFWSRFSVGIAPLVIGIFFFGSVQLIAVGIIGEYVGAIHTQVQRRPLVVERERINFEDEPATPEEQAAAHPSTVAQ